MLFRKKQIRVCAHCVHGTKFDDERILCKKHGVRSIENACRKFSYDPCKRTPSKPKGLDFNKYNDTDFSL